MLNGLFIPTANSGVVYWRMHNFYTSAYRQGIANIPVIWWQRDSTDVHVWEQDVDDPELKYMRVGQLLSWVKQSEIIIFGMLHGPGYRQDTDNPMDYVSKAMLDFRTLKDVFPNKPILTEIDDNMLSTPIYNPANPLYNPGNELRLLAIAQFKESNGLIVSTPELAELYSHLNSNINIIPNSIDFELWNKVKPRSRPGIRIGWAGGASHDEDLKILVPAIHNIMEKHKNVKFVFLHGCPKFIKDIPGVECVLKWTEILKYPQALASLDLDIGLAPLQDNSFNRCKSNIRWLEYSALGIPTVASNVGHFKQTINHGIDGFLAEDDEFEKYITELIINRKFRHMMGAAAKNRVFNDFNVDSTSRHYVDVLSGFTKKLELV